MTTVNIIDIDSTEGKFTFAGAYRFKGDTTPIPFDTIEEAWFFASFAGYSHFKRNGADRRPIPKKHRSIFA